MVFASIRYQPALVLNKICDGQCAYPNVAAMAYQTAASHDDFGMSEVAQGFIELLDPLYGGILMPSEILTVIESLLGEDDGSDTASRAMFRYALEVDQLSGHRMVELDFSRRKQFIQMTFDLSEQGFHSPAIWAEHFLASANLAAE